MPLLFSPHPSVITRVVLTENSGEGKVHQQMAHPHLYADEINIDVLPRSCRVVPNRCLRSCISRASYGYWQEAYSVIRRNKANT